MCVSVPPGKADSGQMSAVVWSTTTTLVVISQARHMASMVLNRGHSDDQAGDACVWTTQWGAGEKNKKEEWGCTGH